MSNRLGWLLAVGLVVLAVANGVVLWQVANPPALREIIIAKDATEAERIVLSCEGGVPSITLYDDTKVACYLTAQNGVGMLAMRDANGTLRYVNEDWGQEDLEPNGLPDR